MSYLLIIDTSLDTATICLARKAEVLATSSNTNQKDHASWLQPAIAELMEKVDLPFSALHAVGVVAGPGSYTGLRVGMASAKGFCYALQIPLITIDALQLLARGFFNEYPEAELVCPMIDARRMEVFTALYTPNMQALLSPQALELESHSFDHWIHEKPIFFVGNGASKYKELLNSTNAFFPEWVVSTQELASFTQEMFSQNAFADLAYAEPNYIKAFYQPVKVKS